MIHSKPHIDIQWMNKISVGLQRFKKVKTNVWTCRCPVCGDSKKSTKLTRFFFYIKKQQMNVRCHNCGYSHSFFMFMKEQYSSQFDDYKRETLFDTFTQQAATTRAPLETRLPTLTLVEAETVSSGIVLGQFEKMSTNVMDLPVTHPARQFLEGRAFTEHEMSRLYYTDDFKSVAAAMNPEAGQNLMAKEPRILIPFVNTDGVVEMLQGRALKESKMKYISIKAHDEVDKLYGLYEMDPTMTSYCVEGPFDSLFVDNCIATCDANLIRSKADVLIFDNQCRNREVCRYMEQAIEEGHSLVVWPFSPAKKVDINDMIKDGVTRKQLMSVIEQSTFKGLTAKMKFMQWKRL